MKRNYWFILWLIFSLFQIAFSESEPNNTFADALNVGEEKAIQGELVGTDKDLFKLSIVGEAQHWRVQVLARQAGVSTVTLYNENQNSQETLRVPAEEKIARLDSIFLEPGTYFLGVEGKDTEYMVLLLALDSSPQQELETTSQQDTLEESAPEAEQAPEELPEQTSNEEELEQTSSEEKPEVTSEELASEQVSSEEEVETDQVSGEEESESEQISSEEEQESQPQQETVETAESQSSQANESTNTISPDKQTEISGTLVGVDTDVLKLNVVGKPQLWLIRAISHSGKLSKITLYDKNLSPKVSLSMPVGEQRASVGDLSLEPSTYFLGVEGEDAEYSIHFLSLGEDTEAEQPFPENSEEQETQQTTSEDSESITLEETSEEVPEQAESQQDSLEEKPESELAEQEPISETKPEPALQEISEDIAEEEIAETEIELEETSDEPIESDIESQPQQDLPEELAEQPKLESQEPVSESELQEVSEEIVEEDSAEIPTKFKGFNIALAELGGKIEYATSKYSDEWTAENLIDGVPFTVTYKYSRYECVSCGWSSSRNASPQEIIFSFFEERETLVEAVIIDTTTFSTFSEPDKFDSAPNLVEVWTSTTNLDEEFTKITEANLEANSSEQIIHFPPTPAKYLKLHFLTNHGGNFIRVGEVKIIEAAETSILADFPRNLANPTLGGSFAWFTSQKDEDNGAHLLLDGQTDTAGWKSSDNSFPQDFVLAFRNNQLAYIEKVILNPASNHDKSTQPQLVEILVSTKDLDNFELIGEFTPTPEQEEWSFSINREARFVKLRILENHGGSYTSLGEIKLFEGAKENYQSILLETQNPIAERSTEKVVVDISGNEGQKEVEPNNTAIEANPIEIDDKIWGIINPLAEEDYFKFTVPSNQSMLTIDLTGQPNIRTSLALQDTSGTVLKQFDPGNLLAEETKFSWSLDAGEYFLGVSEPVSTQVLIWDTSGSMVGRVEDLRVAVENYLDQVPAGVQLNLIRFSDSKAEVLLPEFTSDISQLKTATEGKFFADGGTPFYDAIAKGIELLTGVQGNKAIIVMTDGIDTQSRLGYSDFWQILNEQRIRLYTIGLGISLKQYQPEFATSGEQVLNHAAIVTNGRYLFANTSGELTGIYQQIADELGQISSYSIQTTLDQGKGTLSVATIGNEIRGSVPVSAPQTELIFDASNSMWGQIEGKAKIAIAKDVMYKVIDELPDETEVALRLYGHSTHFRDDSACEDTELVFPFGEIDKESLKEVVQEITPLGTTPIAYSLKQVAEDFQDTVGEKRVVLITDGIEACDGSYAAAIDELEAKGLEVQLLIVAFAISDEATKQELEAAAERTGGEIYDAQSANELFEAISKAVGVPYKVLDAFGATVATGLIGGDAIEVPEGVYTVIVQAEEEEISVPNVPISINMSTIVNLRKEGQEIGYQIQAP